MPITIDGTGTISGINATGLTTAQTVTGVANVTTGVLLVAKLAALGLTQDEVKALVG